MSNIKVLLGIPTLGTVDHRFASSLVSLRIQHELSIMWVVRVMIDSARNMMVERALEDPNITHLLFVDDDMTFPSDVLERLLSWDKDIVGVQAFKRSEPFTPCVFKKKDDQFYPALVQEFSEVDAIGTGILLIRTSVFRKIPYPWFETFYDNTKRHWSVDFTFCKRAVKSGFKIYCDPSLEIGHIGQPPVISRKQFLRQVEAHQDITKLIPFDKNNVNSNKS